MTIAITGASGFIGSKLMERLRANGDTVIPVSLRKSPEPYALADKFDACEAVIHLAGEPVAQRWTAAAKKRILDSRVDGTRLVVTAIERMEIRPAVLVSVSGVGYYGSRGDETLTENSGPGKDFLAKVCCAWEEESRAAEKLGVRVVNPRIGVVLAAEGGALQKMLLPFKLGVGGKIGSGTQWMSWIHVDDLISLFLYILKESSIRGPVNAVAPNPVRNTDFTSELAAALRRPAIFPVPAVALRIALGEMSEMLLGGQKVLPEAARAAGFQFRHPSLPAALEQILQ